MNYYNYFTEIEDHFVRRRGKNLLVSPMDWSLISTWRESGIPLHVALRGIDMAMDSFESKRDHQGRVNSLFYCHNSVMEEYTRHLEAHLGESPQKGESRTESADVSDAKPDDGPDKPLVLEFLAARIAEIERLLPKHSEQEAWQEDLNRVLSRLSEIARAVAQDPKPELESLERDLGILDEVLVSVLRPAAGEEQIERWNQEAKKELKIYRKRLPKETFKKILENYLRGKVHRFFDVGELSLFHL